MGNAHHPVRPTQEEKKLSRTSQRGDDRTQAAPSLSGNPAAVQPRQILHLQRTIGNQQVQRLLATTSNGGVIQREDVETEEIRLIVKSHSETSAKAKIKNIDADSIVRVVVNSTYEIPKEQWVARGGFLYIDFTEFTVRVEPTVHVWVKKGTTQSGSTDETQDSAAESQDTTTEQNESDTAGQETTSTENTSESSAEAGKSESDFENDKDYKAYLLEEIWKAIEEKGIAGAHVQQGMIKRLEIEQLEYLLHEVVKKADSDEKKKAVDDEIEELLGG